MKTASPVFVEKLKGQILEECGYDHIAPETIENNNPIIGDSSTLQMDSIDALEIVVMLKKEYGIVLKGIKSSKTLFKSYQKLANFVVNETKTELDPTLYKTAVAGNP